MLHRSTGLVPRPAGPSPARVKGCAGAAETSLDARRGAVQHTMQFGTPMTEPNVAEHLKRFVNRHFERLLVVVLVASLLLIHNFIEYKLAFLSFYYLPIIAAGFLVGRVLAVWAALLVVLLVIFVQAMQGLDGQAGLHAVALATLVPW